MKKITFSRNQTHQTLNLWDKIGRILMDATPETRQEVVDCFGELLRVFAAPYKERINALETELRAFKKISKK